MFSSSPALTARTRCGAKNITTDPSGQRHNKPNHGRLIYVSQLDGGTQPGNSGIYLELCSCGAAHGKKHRVLLIAPDGTLGNCHNLCKNQFRIFGKDLQCYWIDDQTFADETKQNNLAHMWYLPNWSTLGTTFLCPGYPGRCSDPWHPHLLRSPTAAPLIDSKLDHILAHTALHIVQQEIEQIPPHDVIDLLPLVSMGGTLWFPRWLQCGGIQRWQLGGTPWTPTTLGNAGLPFQWSTLAKWLEPHS